jgi:hypothetical protein
MVEEGLPVFIGTIFQNGEIIPNNHKIYQMAVKRPKGHKIHQNWRFYSKQS